MQKVMNVLRARTWFVLASAVLAAVCIASVVLDPRFTSLPKPTSDGPVYENMAYHLSTGRGFWTDWHDPKWREPYEQSPERSDFGVYLEAPLQSMPMTGRPPLFPALIAIVYKFVDRGPTAFAIVRVISALCLAFGCAIAVANAATVMMKFEVCGRKFSAWSIGFGCAAAIFLAASNRTLLSYASDFLTEPLALLLTQLLVASLLVLPQSQACTAPQPLARWRVVAIGVIVAGMILARSLFVLWLPGLWLLLAVILNSHRLRDATLVIVVAVVSLSPWWIRNCVVLDRFMPLGTQGPITLLGGYCDEALTAGGDWQHGPEQRLRQSMRENATFTGLSTDIARELMIADESKRLVRAWIAEHVSDLPRLFVMRVVTHWNPYTGKSLVWRLLILAGAVYLVSKRRPEAWVLVGLPVMNTVLVASLYTTGGRFLVPLYGILFTLSAIGVAGFVEFAMARFAMKPETAKSTGS
jgi:hypothetical protein